MKKNHMILGVVLRNNFAITLILGVNRALIQVIYSVYCLYIV